ncbi:hypothetical protein FPHYL_13467, partial [Fusarium phyllophilum]
MITNLSPLVALCILLLPQILATQVQTTIQCPSLAPNQHVSRIQCEKYDGSVVEVNDHEPFFCKLSYIAIRSESSEGSTDQQQEHPIAENGKCELLLLQFSDDGHVKQSCCGDAGEGLVGRYSLKGEFQQPDLGKMEQPLEFQGEVPESVQYSQADGSAASEGHKGHKVEMYEYRYLSEDEEGLE